MSLSILKIISQNSVALKHYKLAPMAPKLDVFFFFFLLLTLILCLSSLFFSYSFLTAFLFSCYSPFPSQFHSLSSSLSFSSLSFIYSVFPCFSLNFFGFHSRSLSQFPFFFLFPLRLFFSIFHSFDLFLLFLFYFCLSFTFLSFHLNCSVSILGLPNEDRTYYSVVNDLAR